MQIVLQRKWQQSADQIIGFDVLDGNYKIEPTGRGVEDIFDWCRGSLQEMRYRHVLLLGC